MRLSFVPAVTALIVVSAPAAAVDCANAVTTPEIDACASADQQAVEVKLNAIYKRVIHRLEAQDADAENNEAIKAQLVEAQRAWIKFREADCRALYTYYQEGTIRTLMYIGCMQSHAEQRIKDLEEYEK